jgi:hypothetical protein
MHILHIIVHIMHIAHYEEYTKTCAKYGISHLEYAKQYAKTKNAAYGQIAYSYAKYAN